MQTRMKWMLVLGVAVMTAACGDSKSSFLPTAPSALSADQASVDASTADGHYGATANGPRPANGNGNGNGNGGNGNGNQPRTPTNTSPDPTSPLPPGRSVVQFEGLIDVVGARSITVSGQMIMVTADTVIRHGQTRFKLTDLKPLDRVHVRAKRVEATGGAGAAAESTLEAQEINLQNPGAGDEVSTVPVDPNPLVSVTAVDNAANESGAAGTNTGMFRFSRTGTATQLAQALSVSFTLGGTATADDYAAFGLTANFAANQATVDVTLTPVNDHVSEPMETVVLTLTPGAAYELGFPAIATVNITDDPLPQVNVSATRMATEGSSNGRFVLTRTGSLASRLDVTVQYSGSAVNGEDYSLPTAVVFDVSVSTVTLTVVATADFVNDESLETVILAVTPGALYDAGTSPTATVTITNVNR